MAGLDLTLGQIARIVGGTLFGDASLYIHTVSTDSRGKGDKGLFVALAGDRFDGHDFATMAAHNGAEAVLVHKPIDGLMIPHIRVANTLTALQTLGAEKRRRFEGRVAAITGSSGKTTTRRLLTAMLSQKWSTHGPIKNFNNHIGLPLTLIGLGEAHQAAVLELGCSDFGEIAALTRMADPDVALVTNVGAAHLEKLGSLDGVAKAKGELFLGMREETVAVVNKDDARVAAMTVVSRRKVGFGQGAEADVRLLARESLGIRGQRLTVSLFGRPLMCELPLLGGHNASNALSAAAAATMMDLPDALIAEGMATVTPEPGRLTARATGGGIVIDDTYNANPNSMRAALQTLAEVGAVNKRVAVLGDMLELGDEGVAAHHEIGRAAARSGIDQLVTLGDLGHRIGEGAISAGLEEAAWQHATSHRVAAENVRHRLGDGAVVLVKGSRGMAMEKVVEALLEG